MIWSTWRKPVAVWSPAAGDSDETAGSADSPNVSCHLM